MQGNTMQTSTLRAELQALFYEAYKNKSLQPEKAMEIVGNVLLNADRESIEDYLDKLEAEEWIANSQRVRQNAKYMAFLEKEALELDSWGADDGIEQ